MEPESAPAGGTHAFVDEAEWVAPIPQEPARIWRIGLAHPPDWQVIPAVQDGLGVFAETHGIPAIELDEKLRTLLESKPAPASYSRWMQLAEEVKAGFNPLLRARAFDTLARKSNEEFGLADPYVLEFILASLATLPMAGDPVWGFVVGPPSALKTEFLRWLSGLPAVCTLSRLSPRSLISGLKDGHSLLPELDGKLLVVKDFTVILEMDRKAREEVFSQLRDAFDGYSEAYFGSVGKLSFRSHFHVLAAVTSAIEDYYSAQSFLGPRFLKVRVPLLDGFDRSLEHGGREDEIRRQFEALVRGVASRLEPDAWKRVKFGRVQELRPLVEFLAAARTHVSRQDSFISQTPEPEMLPRLTKQLRKLAIGRAILYGRDEVDDSDLEFVRRVALDTVPLNRAKVLKALQIPGTVPQIAGELRLPHTTIYRHVDELRALQLLSGEGERPELLRLTGSAVRALTPHAVGTTNPPRVPKEVGGPRSGTE